MATKKIELLFSDVDFGVHEWGFLPRMDDPDDEDVAYQKHLRAIGIDARVSDGIVRLKAE